MRHRAAWIGVGVTALLWLAGLANADSLGALANGIKATYLYKFAPYVDWPPDAFPAPTSPLYLCDVGVDPFGDLLDRVVSGQRFEGHPIVVRRLTAIAGSSGCHILFAAGSAEQPVEAMLAALGDAPVLTVTDLPDDGPGKGIINFVIRDNHVRFQIDQRQAAAHHLAISSKLLSLAVPAGR